MITTEELAKYIDHTLLKPTATFADIEKLCDEAKEKGFYSVCVNSCFVKFAVSKLQGTPVKISAVVGFPLGAMATEAKAFEAEQAVRDGASEIDMVMNVGMIKGGDFFEAEKDIEAVVKAAKQVNPGAKVKVILEMCYLNSAEKVSACEIARDAGADFVKTSTGFGPSGATLEDVALLKRLVGDSVGVKAAGGIRDLKTALAMIEAGATRIGTSSGVAIIEEAMKQQ